VMGGSSSAPTITSNTTTSAVAGVPFVFQVTTSHPATSFSASNLPTGLLIDSTYGTISGTPGVQGTFMVSVTASNSSGSYGSVLTLTVTAPPLPNIAPTLTASAVSGSTFSYQIPVTGMVTSYLVTGLPAGLSFDSSTGIISGTASTTGSYPVSILVANDVGTVSSTLTLTVVVVTSFSDWELGYNFNGVANGTPLHDGVPNLLKYFFDINPSSRHGLGHWRSHHASRSTPQRC
jgi:hypothetical protein